MLVASKEQIKQIEARAIVAGLSEERLMENAGTAAARQIRLLADNVMETVVLCGNGNNGGDGFVIARKLAEHAYPVTVILTAGLPSTAAAAESYSKLADIPVISLEAEPYRAAAAVSGAAIAVDAVYGIGFHGQLPQAVVNLFAQVKEDALRVAVDIPSGLESNGKSGDSNAFRATDTVTFIAAKPALVLQENSGVCGNVQVVSIGISEEEIKAVLGQDRLTEADIAACFTKREPDSHKGTYGHLLAVCGSVGMAGAAILSARAALRSGVGLLTVALPKSIYPIVSAAVPEALFLPLPETADGRLQETVLPSLLRALNGKSALLIGCGLGCCADTQVLVYELVQQATCPVVLDADGLNALAPHIDILKTAKAPLVLTPHPGEMARLVGKKVDEVQADRVHIATDFAQNYTVTLALKGNHTVIADATHTYVNTTGNPGMATGGSGDVLAGMIAAFAAQGMSALDAAKCGVYLHGKAGDVAASKHSQHAMLPSDMIEELGGLFLNLE